MSSSTSISDHRITAHHRQATARSTVVIPIAPTPIVAPITATTSMKKERDQEGMCLSDHRATHPIPHFQIY